MATAPTAPSGKKGGNQMLYVGLGIVVVLIILGAIYWATTRTTSPATTTVSGVNSINQTKGTVNTTCPCLSETQFQALVNDSSAAKASGMYRTNYTNNVSKLGVEFTGLLANFTGKISDVWIAEYQNQLSANYTEFSSEIIFQTNNATGLYAALNKVAEGSYTGVNFTVGPEVNGFSYTYFAPSGLQAGPGSTNILFGYKNGYVVAYTYSTVNHGASSAVAAAAVIAPTV
jgi:hypothetical protein